MGGLFLTSATQIFRQAVEERRAGRGHERRARERHGGGVLADPEGAAAQIIKFTHKWHKSYIKALRWILKVTGVFKKAKITDEAAQMKAATLLYYTIIAGFAVYSGVHAVQAFKTAVASAGSAGGSFSLSALESGMTAIKSGEVVEFLGELGLAVKGGDI